jgi:hypothetical protein
MTFNCPETDLYKILAAIVLLCLEYWLGKTDRVKSGSILEVLFMVTLGLVIFLTATWGNICQKKKV